VAKRPGCRRRHPRHPLDASHDARVEVGSSRPGDPPRVLRLRDVSEAGLGFVLGEEVAGLEVGDSIDGVTIRVGARVARGDLLVMHLTPDRSEGSVCGALFYPAADEDLLVFREILRDLEARDRQAHAAAP